MRTWKITREAVDHFDELLRQGAKMYEKETVDSKRKLVIGAIRSLADTMPGFEQMYQRDKKVGLYRYFVPHTPFVIFFSINESDVYVERIAHYREDRSHLPLSISE